MIQKKARISKCEKYRYFLERKWIPASSTWLSVDPTKPYQLPVKDRIVLFIGLNPSIADANIDDPTIRRCINFAKTWGYNRLWMGNVMAFRSTNPKNLYNGNNFTPESSKKNYLWLKRMIKKADLVVCAWGANEVLVDIGELYHNMLKEKKAVCLGKTKSGKPKHPLYIKGDTKPIDY